MELSEIKITDIRVEPGDSAFLIDDGVTSIMYDAGFAFTGYEIADKIKSILGDRSLDYIFLTHSHYDHVLGSVYALKYWPEAKVVAGEHAAEIFKKPTARAVMRELDSKFAKTCGIDTYEDLIDELKVDIVVKDGDIIKAGDMEFEVLSLPGHTKCSIGFYCARRKMLLSCETIGVYDGKTVMPVFLVGYQMTLNSIARVEALDIESILVSHHGMLSGDAARKYIKDVRKSTVQIADWIVSLLRKGISKEEIIEGYKDWFYHGIVRRMYPIDALKLNTGIIINLLEKEFGIATVDL